MRSKILPVLGAAAVLLFSIFTNCSSVLAASATEPSEYPATSFSNQASALLRQIQTNAAAVRSEADRLGMFAADLRYPSEHVGYWPEAILLTRVRNQVNAMDQAMNELRTHAAELQPWQKRAVQHLAPDVAVLTLNTQGAITVLERNRPHLFTATKPLSNYSTNLEDVAQHIDRSTEQLDLYAGMHNELERLRHTLHLPS